MNTWMFMKKFFRDPHGIGSLLPSSPLLARAMVRGLKLSAGDSVVELGPGTGSFTGCIKSIIPHTGGYLGIERESSFVEILEKRFADLRFVNGRAEEARELCLLSGVDPVKVIISGLPFAGVGDETQLAIVASLRELMTAGTVFRTFQYVHTYCLPLPSSFRQRMNGIASSFHRSRPVLGNLPPAFVLTWVS